jgi:hypothetical protein
MQRSLPVFSWSGLCEERLVERLVPIDKGRREHSGASARHEYQRRLLSLILRCGLAMGNFLDELMGGSFFAEVIERKDSRSVAFQGLITLKATFFQEKVAGT